MFSAEDVDASLFADEPEGRCGDDDDGAEVEDDMLDDLIDGFCRESLKPQSTALATTVTLAQFDKTSAETAAASKRRRLGAPSATSTTLPKSNLTLTALWSSSGETATEVATTISELEEYQPPLRLPNVGGSHISESQRIQLFPEEEDLRAIARWIIEDDHIAVCCACLEDLWAEEDAETVPADVLSRFASYIKEEKDADEHRIGLISSCHHMFHERCIDKWAETENACCQCKQRFGLMAIYTEEGKRVDVRSVKKRLQSHTIREEQLNDTAGHICYICHQLGDRDSLMQCALCDVYSHWYCNQYDAMPSEPWHCLDHQPRAVRTTAAQESSDPRRAVRRPAQARAPGRNRQTSRVTGNFPMSLTTRRGRGATTGNAVLREAINTLNQPEPSAAALADTWLPAHTMTDAFDIPFDPAATSYAEFHRPREREQQRITKSSINDLLSGEVSVAELMGKPTQDRIEGTQVSSASAIEAAASQLVLAPGSRMRGVDIMSRSNPAAEAAHEQNQQLARRAEEHELRAKQHREKESEHTARATYYNRRKADPEVDRENRREAFMKARDHEQKGQEHASRAREHEDRAKLLRQSANSAQGLPRPRKPQNPIRPRPNTAPIDRSISRSTSIEQTVASRAAPPRQLPPKSSLEAALAGLQKFANKKSM